MPLEPLRTTLLEEAFLGKTQEIPVNYVDKIKCLIIWHGENINSFSSVPEIKGPILVHSQGLSFIKKLLESKSANAIYLASELINQDQDKVLRSVHRWSLTLMLTGQHHSALHSLGTLEM